MNNKHNRQPVIVCAANKYGDIIVCSPRHHDVTMNVQIFAIGKDKCKPSKGCQGFVDQYGKFYSRKDAMRVVKESGQLFDIERNVGNDKVLYSEGLY